MQLLYFVIIGCFCAAVATESSKCTTPNGEEAQCISLRSCPVLLSPTVSDDFVEASICGTCGKFTVCCGTLGNYTRRDPVAPKPEVTTVSEITEEERKKLNRKYVMEKLLPSRKYCGQQHWDDYFHTEEEENDTEASVDEFPWLVAFKDTIAPCTAFLINRRYIITTDNCIQLQEYYNNSLLMGVHHIRKNISCITTTQFGEDCTDGAKELYIQERFRFPFSPIRLAKLTEDVYYTDFIRPICLPFEESDRPKINDSVMVSGWGIANYLQTSHTKVLIKKRIKARIGSHDECALSKIAPETCVVPFSNTTCWYNSGPPVMYKFKNNWYPTALTEAVGSGCLPHLDLYPHAHSITPAIVDKILDTIYDNEVELKT